MENFFTPENWNYSQFKNDNHFAFISLLADPNMIDQDFSYCVTVLDEAHNEIFQKPFTDLEQACLHINRTYQDFWLFTDMRGQSSASGCSTCVAH